MKDKELNNKLIAAVRIRGRVNVRGDITETLDRLRLKRVNNCVVIKVNDSYMGMINKCSSYIAYGEVNEEVLSKLLEKGGIEMKPSDLEKAEDSDKLKESLPIRLHPPRHGFKSTKLGFKQGGSLGYMGEEINGLISRMI
ncbi:50S ribosomal protein L30p [Candidatus Mancarchaeum acidiphilum]|uniref:50S ribosomal protein L30p n=1 Tax=Candidatus Mancarchaeum acidiphilum TaxID=1920749 RepID=A0A218NNZ5_9ARCH|nr:uL30 family ribosomal protein [Candidatus Mancarchaeum acidiphilum]ASI14192.1 50S ribosomal protein L30p [Candidatus Mancarchaeum acidiphilum]